MKIAIYARVSTTQGQDPEMQLRELRDYCQRRNWEVAREYVDVGISGAKEKRPEKPLGRDSRGNRTRGRQQGSHGGHERAD